MNNKRRIFVFGNPRVRADSLPLWILPKLRKRFPKIEFVVADPTEMLDYSGEEVWILDSATGIADLTIFEHLSAFQSSPHVSVHDYDLALELKLLQKLGKLGKVRIVALPTTMGESEALARVSSCLTSLFGNQG